MELSLELVLKILYALGIGILIGLERSLVPSGGSDMVGKKNAGLLPLRGHSNVQGISSVGLTPQLKAKAFENIESHLGAKLPNSAGMDTIECMNASEKGEIDLGVFLGGNLYASNPDSEFAEKALNNISFKLFFILYFSFFL